MKQHLSHAHQATYDAILRHPAAHNLQWRDVRSLLGALGEVVEEASGKITVTRNGQTLVLHHERQKDVGTEEDLKHLREFLERSDDDAAAPAAPIAEGVNVLVVIDHRQACIYKTETRGSTPERIVPYDPHGDGRHLHYVENDSNGQRRPERKSFYDAIAKSLEGADGILIFGGGTGASSAMEQLRTALELHHKQLAAKVVGTVVVDEHHQTEDQLLAKARAFYAERAGLRNVTV